MPLTELKNIFKPNSTIHMLQNILSTNRNYFQVIYSHPHAHKCFIH